MSETVRAVVDPDYIPAGYELEDEIKATKSFIMGLDNRCVHYECEPGFIEHFKKMADDVRFGDDDDADDTIMDYFYRYDLKRALTREEIDELKAVCRSEVDTIHKCIEICFGNEYRVRPIRGSCQGDYATLFIPTSESEYEIELIEAYYFGMGYGVWVSSDEECSSPDDVMQSGYAIYIPWSSVDKIKETVAENMECPVSAVELWEIYGYTKTPKYRLA